MPGFKATLATRGRTKNPAERGFCEVGGTGLEPVTPSLSTQTERLARGRRVMDKCRVAKSGAADEPFSCLIWIHRHVGDCADRLSGYPSL
jgi:hypothetical protein